MFRQIMFRDHGRQDQWPAVVKSLAQNARNPVSAMLKIERQTCEVLYLTLRVCGVFNYSLFTKWLRLAIEDDGSGPTMCGNKSA
jgi:hypothetical protein